jgi:hypothetical protein
MATQFPQRLVPVPCADLVPGLYVAELDRPWLQTPYPAQGFRLTDEAQIAELRRHCSYVYVDPERGALPTGDFEDDRFATGLTRRLPALRPGLEPTPLADARQHLRALAHGLASALAAGREGLPLPVATLRALAQPLVAAMARDADTLPWLLATELKVGLLARRALGTGLLLGQFARRLGHGDGDAADLLLAGLLLDIGKLTVPVTILAKPGPLSGAERAFVRRHVRRGLYLARTGADLPEAVEDAIVGHHERLDGSGYPRGCSGTAIPLAGRMAGIADTYDALTLDRRYAAALPASGALRTVSRGRGRRFDTALLRTFIRALGVFPTGGWVQLADGRLGIVRAQTPGDPLRPRVALVSDSAGRALPVAGRLWSPIRRGDILRGLAPSELRLAAGVLEPALLAAAAA